MLIGVIILLLAIFSIVNLFYSKDRVQVSEIKLEQLEIETEPEVVEKTIKVDIKGNVQNPGVYEFKEGTRVIDAINTAGGLMENSNTDLINLSQQLTDEMIIIIYTNDQINEYKNNNTKVEYVYIEVPSCPDKINDACINKQTELSQKEEANEEESNSKISINQANVEELTSLSGIGEKKANDIIEYRNQNGNFKTIEDLKNVNGIGDALFEKIKDYITI